MRRDDGKLKNINIEKTTKFTFFQKKIFPLAFSDF